MLRKMLSLAALSLLSAPSFAGFYLGASVGPEGAQFTQKSVVIRPATFYVYDKQHFAGTGVFGSLFGGYGLPVYNNRFYAALEANVNISSVEYLLNNNEYLHHNFSRTYFKVKNSAGISILPGYFLSENTIAYGRIGFENAQIRLKESDPSIRSFNGNRNGIRYGLGIRHFFTPGFAAMVDYSQINYRYIRSFVFDPMGGVTKHSTIYPDTAQVGFGIIYRFDAPTPYVGYVK